MISKTIHGEGKGDLYALNSRKLLSSWFTDGATYEIARDITSARRADVVNPDWQRQPATGRHDKGSAGTPHVT